MKPNGMKFVVRSMMSALCAVGLFSVVGNAETMRGTFTLPTEARWGRMILAPGEYEFRVDTQSAGRIVTVLSEDSRWSGMIMAESVSDASSRAGSVLELARSESGTYVKTLYLGDLGLALDFGSPKAGSAARLTKLVPSTTIASVPGAH